MKSLYAICSVSLVLLSVFGFCRCSPLAQSVPTQGLASSNTSVPSNVTNSNSESGPQGSAIENQISLSPLSLLPPVDLMLFNSFISALINRASVLVDSHGRDSPTSETFTSVSLGLAFGLSPARDTHGLYTYGAFFDTARLLQEQLPPAGYPQVIFRLYSPGNEKERTLIGLGSLTSSALPLAGSDKNGTMTNTSSTMAALPTYNSTVNLTTNLDKTAIEVEVEDIPGSSPFSEADFSGLISDAQKEVKHVIDIFDASRLVGESWQIRGHNLRFRMYRRDIGQELFTYGVLAQVINSTALKVPKIGYQECQVTAWLGLEETGELIARGTLGSITNEANGQNTTVGAAIQSGLAPAPKNILPATS